MIETQHQSTSRSVEIAEVCHQLNVLVDQVSKEEARVLVTKDGVPVAVLVSPPELSRLDLFERQRAERFKIIDKVREAFEGVPDEEIERKTDRIFGINQETAQLASGEDEPEPSASTKRDP